MTLDVGAPRWWRCSAAFLAVAALACSVISLVGDLEWVDFFWPVIAGVALLVVGVGWLINTAIGAIRFRVWQIPALTALIVSLIGVVIWSGLATRAAFHTSSDALEDVASSCVESGPRWVGAIRLEAVRQSAGLCLLFTPGGFLDSQGWTRLPDGPPADARARHGLSLRHYNGEWYRFTWHF